MRQRKVSISLFGLVGRETPALENLSRERATLDANGLSVPEALSRLLLYILTLGPSHRRSVVSLPSVVVILESKSALRSFVQIDR